MIRILQYSDTHTANNNINAVNNIINTSSNIDFYVTCGDSVSKYFENGIGTLNLETSACVIGNHDASTQEGWSGSYVDWSKQPSISNLYNRYIQPGVNNNIYTTTDVNSGAWIKITDKCIYIGINDTALNNTASLQQTWLQNQINNLNGDARPVIMIKHGSCNLTTPINCNFTSKTANTYYSTSRSEYASIYPQANSYVSMVANSNLNFKLLLSGHTHYDVFGVINNKIPNVVITSTYVDVYNDLPRSTTSTEQVCTVMNLIELSDNYLKIYRLGSNGSSSGATRRMLVWSYKTNSIVAQN